MVGRPLGVDLGVGSLVSVYHKVVRLGLCCGVRHWQVQGGVQCLPLLSLRIVVSVGGINRRYHVLGQVVSNPAIKHGGGQLLPLPSGRPLRIGQV